MSDRSTYTFTFTGLKSEQFPAVAEALGEAFEADSIVDEHDIRVEGEDAIIEIPEIDYDAKIHYAEAVRDALSEADLPMSFRLHVAGCYDKNARLVTVTEDSIIVTQADEQGNALVSLADIAAAAQRPDGIAELLADLSA